MQWQSYSSGEHAFSARGWAGIRYVCAVATMAVLYFAASKLGFTMAFAAEQVTVVWPPTGIALAGVMLLGNRIWPGIALGAFLANITTDEPVMTACCIALGNTMEAIAGGWILRGITGADKSLSRLRHVLALLVAALTATMISATTGVASLCLGGLQPWQAFRSLWLIWWLGDLTGALIVAPVLLVWGNNPFFFWEKRDLMEAAAMVTSLAAVSFGIFIVPTFSGASSEVFIYFAFPFILWAALRFGQRGATFVTLAISAAALTATYGGIGPFSILPTGQSLVLLQVFMAVVAVTGLFLGAAISERRQAEDTRAMLAAIVESSRDAIVGRDLGGVITFWNSGAERMFGYSAAEAIGQRISLIIPPERQQEEEQVMQRLRLGELIDKPYETTAVTRDERLLDVSLTFSPIRDENGRIVGASKTIRDLAAHKQIEKTLREADRHKNEFLAMLAHELRNPLAPLSNALQILKQPGTDAKRRTEAQNIMEGQLRHMVRLVDDLLDVSRISHGKVTLRRERVTLNEVVNLALETAKPMIEQNSHTLALHLPKDKVWLDADLTRLAQILANLLGNAAKYTPPGGYISLQAVALTDTVEIRIFDTGIGIPRAMLPHIFGMFTQVDGSMERAHGGLGIGLMLVKQFVEMHGGSVEARSEGTGKGSEFIVRLPLATAPEAETPPAPQPVAGESKESHPLRVLVVDDSKVLAQTLGWMIDTMGHETAFAHTGEEAIAHSKAYRPDVVLLDIGLPGMNGYEVCRQLRAEPGMEHAVIVAQTGWGQPEHRMRSQEAGFNHHLIKPVTLQTLEQLFQSLS